MEFDWLSFVVGLSIGFNIVLWKALMDLAKKIEGEQ
tara:strand:+ start:226 stop:333 length:108 start_codon:yes stop_codon:yes gene_type:complete